MSKGPALVGLLCAIFVSCSWSYAVTPDRVTGDLTGGPRVALRGNVHGMARPEFDLGRADGNKMMHSVSLVFRPSSSQQVDLERFMSQLGDPKSPNFHKYLTPKQFGQRFGMSQADIDQIAGWLQSEGFTNISVSNSRNEVSFDGTLGQVESVFSVEMHNYLINGEVHLANANDPIVPAALAKSMLTMGHLHDFAPRARARIQSHLTSYVSGNHFLTPDDFATIYDLGSLYTAAGSGQKIAVVGQSTVSTTDLNHFRSAAGLPASTVAMTMVPGGTATKCKGDEGESELDIEWSGGVAKSASITFVYAPVSSGDTCSSRQGLNVWDALNYAVQHNVAPFISMSYGFCEPVLLQTSFPQQVQLWAQQAVSQGQTIVAASGDEGAADCEDNTSTSATKGLAVDVPAAIPEVTGAGGNEFTTDSPTFLSNNPPGADSPYWSAAGASTDTISSALEYITEGGWNDTSLSISGGDGFSASGGGPSSFFQKPSWQTGIGVPADGKRDVPDISLSASQFHDPYLVCSEDSQVGVNSCSTGFRDSIGGNLTAVGGTSAAAPTFTAILALLNQYLGNTPPTGLAPINPMLYSLAATTASFHDVKTGDNKVPCTAPSTNCPTGTTSIGFTAGTGYDQVTGLGSPDAFEFAKAWAATIVNFSMSASAVSPASIAAGGSATTTITVTPQNGFTGTVTLSCPTPPNGVTCTFNPTTVANGSGTTQLTITTMANMAAGTPTITVKGASGTTSATASANLTVTATTMSFTLATTPSPLGTVSVARGQTSTAIDIAVTSNSMPSFVTSNGSGQTTALPLNYACTGLPSESKCIFSPSSSTSSIAPSLTIRTTAPTAKLRRPFDRGAGIFYAVLLPGLLGIVFAGTRKGSRDGMRVLGLIVVLGLSTAWMASCGGTSSSSNKDPGTPTGPSTVTVTGSTGGAAPLTSSFSFTLAVTP